MQVSCNIHIQGKKCSDGYKILSSYNIRKYMKIKIKNIEYKQ